MSTSMSSDRHGDTTKRVFDTAVASLAVIVTAPVVGMAALAVALTMGRPVLFRHIRPGLHGQPFTLLKLRSMRDPKFADEPDDDRLTRTGRILRSFSLDELPQFVNVLRGDMSLVGPRPLITSYLPLFSERQARRHEVRPGITGWAQVRGRNALSWDERLELDVWYVENRSFLLDLRILLETVLIVIRRKGIAQEGRATMEAFRGSAPDASADHSITSQPPRGIAGRYEEAKE